MLCVSVLKEDNTSGTKYLAVLRMQVSANIFFCCLIIQPPKTLSFEGTGCYVAKHNSFQWYRRRTEMDCIKSNVYLLGSFYNLVDLGHFHCLWIYCEILILPTSLSEIHFQFKMPYIKKKFRKLPRAIQKINQICLKTIMLTWKSPKEGGMVPWASRVSQ